MKNKTKTTNNKKKNPYLIKEEKKEIDMKIQKQKTNKS